DLVGAIERGEVSSFSVGVRLGWFQRPPTLTADTHQARKRQHRFRAPDDDLRPAQLMELKFGPNPATASYFGSREELEDAWRRSRERLMASTNPGRRPQAFYEFEYSGARPPYDLERSTLWRKGLLAAEERATLERWWKAEFTKAHAPGFSLS